MLKVFMQLKFPLLALILVYGLILLYFFLDQESFIYFPVREIAATPAAIGLEYEDVLLETSDGVTISAWFIPAPGGSPRGALLFCHGNAGNISHRLDSIRIFSSLGLDTLIFDYRGYGRSGGRVSEEGTYLDAAAAYAYLRDTRQIPEEKIILFGRSLGGAVAARAAAEEPGAGALILESVFTSIPDLGAGIYPFIPVRLLARFRYDTRSHLGDAALPVLLVHSRGDEIIPFSHGEKLYAAAPGKKAFLEISGSHNEGFIMSAASYINGIGDFLDTVFAPGD